MFTFQSVALLVNFPAEELQMAVTSDIGGDPSFLVISKVPMLN